MDASVACAFTAPDLTQAAPSRHSRSSTGACSICAAMTSALVFTRRAAIRAAEEAADVASADLAGAVSLPGRTAGPLAVPGSGASS